MRHHNANRKFGRTMKQRNALLKSLILALITKGKIKTTGAKAKEIRPLMEKMVTKAKAGDLATRRLVASRLWNNKSATKKLFDEIAPKYKTVKGGYTRIVKLPARKGDASPMAVIEFI
jgi:large subunit ribosomal protein L17